MKNKLYMVLLMTAVLAIAGCGGKKDEAQTAGSSVSAASAEADVTAEPEADEAPAVTGEPTPEVTEEPTPEVTETPEPTAEPTPTPAPELTAEPVTPEEAAAAQETAEAEAETAESTEEADETQTDEAENKEEAEESGPYTAASGDEYIGTWYSGRATLEVQPSYDQYLCVVTWANSAFEYYAWEYFCTFENGSLVCSGTGTKTDVVFGEDGNVASSAVLFSDGSATFTLNKDRRITWDESVEDSGNGVEFEW